MSHHDFNCINNYNASEDFSQFPNTLLTLYKYILPRRATSYRLCDLVYDFIVAENVFALPMTLHLKITVIISIFTLRSNLLTVSSLSNIFENNKLLLKLVLKLIVTKATYYYLLIRYAL